MKRNALVLAKVGLALFAGLFTAAALQAAPAATREFHPPTLKRPVSLIFPERALFNGLITGTVIAQIEVDENGTVVDWLPIEATNDVFIPPVAADVMSWKFNPATENGGAIPCDILVELQFKKDFAVSLNVQQMANVYMNTLSGALDRRESKVARISQLDALPKPVHIVVPDSRVVPPEKRNGSATFTFFIDQKGKVRMPVATQYDCDRVLATAAYQAMREWQFAPCTVKGTPVVVRAQQRFDFTLTASGEAPAGPAAEPAQ